MSGPTARPRSYRLPPRSGSPSSWTVGPGRLLAGDQPPGEGEEEAALRRITRPHQSSCLLTSLQLSPTATPVPFEETKAIREPAPASGVPRRVTEGGTITIWRARYTVGSSFAGQSGTSLIKDRVGHYVHGGKIVTTLP